MFHFGACLVCRLLFFLKVIANLRGRGVRLKGAEKGTKAACFVRPGVAKGEFSCFKCINALECEAIHRLRAEVSQMCSAVTQNVLDNFARRA